MLSFPHLCAPSTFSTHHTSFTSSPLLPFPGNRAGWALTEPATVPLQEGPPGCFISSPRLIAQLVGEMGTMNELFLNPEHFIQLCRLRAGSPNLRDL